MHTGVALIVPSNAGVHFALQITNKVWTFILYVHSVLEPYQAWRQWFPLTVDHKCSAGLGHDGVQRGFAVTTIVEFAALSSSEIAAYIATGLWLSSYILEASNQMTALNKALGCMRHKRPFIWVKSCVGIVLDGKKLGRTIVGMRRAEASRHAGEPFGKAGAYGIQGPAGAWVKQIQGDYFSVMGLPVHAFAAEVASMLEDGLLSSPML